MTKLGSFDQYVKQYAHSNKDTKITIMKTINFPYIAMALGVMIMMIVVRGSEIDSEGITALPLLTLLIANECAFILTFAGSYIGLKQLKAINFNIKLKPLYAITTLICILLTIQFTLLGIKLWPL